MNIGVLKRNEILLKCIWRNKGGNVFNKSARLFTLSITIQNTQKKIENDGKITFDRIRKHRLYRMPFAEEKSNSHKIWCCKWYFVFPGRFVHFRVVDIFFQHSTASLYKILQ